jgi:hypothetical protein
MKMPQISGPSEVDFPDGAQSTTYDVTVEGGPTYKGQSLWVRQDVFDTADAEVDLAQYIKVRPDGIATMTLGVTPSWPDIPGGGGRIELILGVFGNRWRTLDKATVTLLP